jgi:hypothetical protein
MRRPKYWPAIGNGSVRPLAASIAAISPARVASSKPDSRMIAFIAAQRSLVLSSAFSVLAGGVPCGIVFMLVLNRIRLLNGRNEAPLDKCERRFVIYAAMGCDVRRDRYSFKCDSFKTIRPRRLPSRIKPISRRAIIRRIVPTETPSCAAAVSMSKCFLAAFVSNIFFSPFLPSPNRKARLRSGNQRGFQTRSGRVSLEERV